MCACDGPWGTDEGTLSSAKVKQCTISYRFIANRVYTTNQSFDNQPSRHTEVHLYVVYANIAQCQFQHAIRTVTCHPYGRSGASCSSCASCADCLKPVTKL
eukprot:scpid82203/ scgid34419/ 